MTEPATTQLFSPATIAAVAEFWKLGACIVIGFACFLFRKPITHLLLNLRKIKRNNTEIEIAPPPTEPATQDPTIPLPQKPLPEAPIEETPEPPADADSLFSEMFTAIFDRDNPRARELRDQWMERNPNERPKIEVLYLALLCKFQKDADAAHELQQLRQNETYSDEFPYMLMTLGEFYESIDQPAIAMQFFKEWEETAINPLGKANAVIAKSRVLGLLETPEIALQFLQQNISRFEEHDCLAQVYHQIAETYRLMGNELMQCIALEKVIQYRPTNATDRFSAAYAQSSAHLPHLSMNNYERIFELDPSNSYARNNYAVILANFGILSKSVEQYEKAQAEGNSLAAANLAYLYIGKGLIGDATRLLRAAQKTENYHENIDRALADLHKMEESENEKISKVRRWIPVFQKFFRRYADARLIPTANVQQIGGSWSSESTGLISITQDNSTFDAEWKFENSWRRLHGVQYNNGAEIWLYSEITDPFVSEGEARYGPPQEALGYISNDGSKLVILSFRENEPRMLSLLRVRSNC